MQIHRDVAEFDNPDDAIEQLRSAIVGESSFIYRLGCTVSTREAYRQYRAKLSWYRRWFWPWLTQFERVKAVYELMMEE